MSLEEEEDFDPVPPSLDIESRELSRGSYGVVYRGRLGEKSVAVKRIHPVLLREEGSECLLKVFKNECRYLKILDHPNVVRFMGAFRDKEGPLLVMELMEENLETFLKRNRGTLSFRRQLEICNSIAKGYRNLRSLTSISIYQKHNIFSYWLRLLFDIRIRHIN